MYYAFQDRENLYLVMDYLSGGDLRYHICRHRRFTEEVTRKLQIISLNLCRFLCSVPCLRTRVFPRKEHYSQRHQAWEPSPWRRRLSPHHWLWYCTSMAWRKCSGHFRNSRLYGSRSDVQTKSYHISRLLCRRSNGIRVHVRKSNYSSFLNAFFQRPYIGKSRKEIRDHILSK